MPLVSGSSKVIRLTEFSIESGKMPDSSKGLPKPYTKLWINGKQWCVNERSSSTIKPADLNRIA